MKLGKLHYSFVVALAIIAVLGGLKITTSARSADESPLVFVERVGEFFGLGSAPVFSNAEEMLSETSVAANEASLGTIPVSLPTVSASPGTLIVIPVTTADVSGRGVISYDFNVDFNPAILTPASPSFDTAGTLSSTMSITPNANFTGHLIITAFQATPLTGSGTLINLRFNVSGTATPGQTTGLIFADYTDPNMLFHPAFVYNEGDPPSSFTSGFFTVAGPTPTSTSTFTPTPSATNTFTPTPSSTDTPTPSSTNTFTPTNSATNTPSASPSGTPPPTLGVYPPSTSVALSDNITITPDAPPTMTDSISVSTSTNFIGELTADPVTGVVSVTNAHHANISPGTYALNLTAFGPGGTTQATIGLTVTNGLQCYGFPGITSPTVAEVGVGDSPRSLAIGDFNNDGNQDMAVPNYIASNVSIRLGDGAAGFTSPVIPEVAVGAFPRSVAIGDFNGDGKQDIATAGFALGAVSIRLGDGLGGFSGTTEVAVDKAPYSIAVGDFNGDGRADFATANSSSANVSIRLGDGLGGFTPAAVPSVDVVGNPRSVVIADFNGDGKQDFATANSASANVSIRLGDGLGGFTLPVTPEVSLGTAHKPRSLAIGDFNADGSQDLLAANFEANNVSVLLGNGSGGFTPAAVPQVSVGNAPQAVAVGDFSNDGKQDFATASSSASTVSIRYGDGSGGFTLPATSEVSLGGTTPLAIAIGDLNGDGIQDFATANDGSDNVSLRLGLCTPFTLSGTVTYGNAAGAPNPRYVSNATVTATGSSVVSTTTGAPGPGEGQYVLNLFGPGPYTVSLTKTNIADGTVNSFDAALIARHVTAVEFLSGNQLPVADVSGNNLIQSFDAAQVARYTTALTGNTGQSGNWRFYTVPNIPFPPGTTPTSRTYPSITGNIAGEDYTALRMGDVSGNWQNTGLRPAASTRGPERGIAVDVPRLAAAAGSEVIVPVSVGDVANKGIISYEFVLKYDPAVLQPLAKVVDVAGTVSRGLTVVTNAQEPGVLRVAVYGALPIAENGVLMNFRFTAIGPSGSESPLTWERIMFNEGEPRVTVTDGLVEISAKSE